jgi:L-threonylcarbamoyladenylate synthase
VIDDTVDRAIAELAAGGLVVLPTDTVYGLACTPSLESSTRALYNLKGRMSPQPTALLAATVDDLVALIPELRGEAESAIRVLLPGPYTLVVANPARRFPWLCGAKSDTIGVRVPALIGAPRAVLAAVRVIVATSANVAGGPDPRTIDEVPESIRQGVAVSIDEGPLPGVPSTVIDLTGAAPVLLREGAAPFEEARVRIARGDV